MQIDCEGCEWVTFDDWIAPGMPKLNQILVELRKPPLSIANKFFDILQANGYLRFHKEPNIKYPGAEDKLLSTHLKLSTDFFPPEKHLVTS